MPVEQLSQARFKEEVLKDEKLVIVDFWAPWCGPCQTVTPVLEALAQKYNGRLKVCKINIDENQLLATEYQILSVPTLLFFKQGKIIKQLGGTKAAADAHKTVEALLR